MLHGIGGRTIAEAKRNITVVEFYQWCNYINLRGTLNVAEKLESVGALLALWINRTGMQTYKKANGQEFEQSDFMPSLLRLHAEDEERELTVAEVMNALLGGSNRGR